MNIAAKIEGKFEEYMERFVHKAIRKECLEQPEEIIVPEPPRIDLLAVHSELTQTAPVEDPKEIKRRARAALANRSDSQRVVDRYIKDNRKDLLSRRHELSPEQNEAIDNFLRLELLADKKET